MKIIIDKNKKGLFFSVVAGNNKEIARSDTYKSKRSIAEAITLLKAGFPEAAVVDKA